MLAVAVLAVLPVSATALVMYATSGQSGSVRAAASETALFAAESGLAEALARLGAAPDPRVGTLLPVTATSVGPADVTYAGAYDAATQRWHIGATATVAAPTGGAAPVQRTVEQWYQVSGGTPTVAANPAYAYIFTASPTGCTEIDSSAQIRQPMYITSDLCMDSSARVFPEAHTLQVGGRVNLNSSVSIGLDAANRLPVFRVGGAGCRADYPYYSTGGSYTFPCTTAHRVYATTQINSVTAVSKPAVDLAYWYQNAKPGPTQACTSFGGPVPVFDNDTTMNRSAGNQNLLPNSSYDCVVTIGGVQVGRLRWQYGSPRGTLTIQGTVFIDGHVNMGGSNAALVSGRGTVYVSGTITLGSSLQICGAWDSANTTCDWATWDPETSLIVLVAGSIGGEATGIQLNSSVRLQAAMYAVNDIAQTSSVITQGPQIARQVDYSSSTGSLHRGFTTLPAGAPGQSSWQIAPVPGTWRG